MRPLGLMLLGLNNTDWSQISVYLGNFRGFLVFYYQQKKFAWLPQIIMTGIKCTFTQTFTAI